MKTRMAPTLALASLVIAGQAYAGSQSDAAVAAATRSLPKVSWEHSSVVDVNFDGKQTGSALLGYGKDRIYVAVFRSRASTVSKPRVLEFGVGSSQQAAVCEVPAKLQVEELVCRPMDEEALPGCRPSPKTMHLVVSGGDCDPIVIYWNHKLKAQAGGVCDG